MANGNEQIREDRIRERAYESGSERVANMVTTSAIGRRRKRN